MKKCSDLDEHVAGYIAAISYDKFYIDIDNLCAVRINDTLIILSNDNISSDDINARFFQFLLLLCKI